MADFAAIGSGVGLFIASAAAAWTGFNQRQNRKVAPEKDRKIDAVIASNERSNVRIEKKMDELREHVDERLDKAEDMTRQTLHEFGSQLVSLTQTGYANTAQLEALRDTVRDVVDRVRELERKSRV